MAQAGGYIEVTIRFFKEGKQWTAQCVELGTATCADTLEDAQVAIDDMIELHLNSLEQLGICEAFLGKHGVIFHKGSVSQSAGCQREVPVRTGELVGSHRIALSRTLSRSLAMSM